jgi:hypothetical protein
VTNLCRCVCCDNPLEPAQQLRFLVETDTLDNPSYLNRIRMLPSVNGKPVPVCTACQAHLEAHPTALEPKPRKRVAPLSLLGALGALSIGLIVGSLFTSRG